MEKRPNPGRHFEEAVFAFVQALDPTAEVLFDHHVPDRDTGVPRQCDAWINTTLFGHWPLAIYVSCKDTADAKRKLGSGDIGTFMSEIRDRVGASTGVIYSHAGFTKPALRKAKANGLSCCKLYLNELCDIPQAFSFTQFVSIPRMKLQIAIDHPYHGIALSTWQDVFDVQITDGPLANMLEVMAYEYLTGQKAVVEAGFANRRLPGNWERVLTISLVGFAEPFNIVVTGYWTRYRSRQEATLLNGSYCLSNGSFKGETVGPSFDIRSENPGEGWTLYDDETLELPSGYCSVILQYDVKTALIEVLSQQSLYCAS